LSGILGLGPSFRLGLGLGLGLRLRFRLCGILGLGPSLGFGLGLRFRLSGILGIGPSLGLGLRFRLSGILGLGLRLVLFAVARKSSSDVLHKAKLRKGTYSVVLWALQPKMQTNRGGLARAFCSRKRFEKSRKCTRTEEGLLHSGDEWPMIKTTHQSIERSRGSRQYVGSTED
jgi:hypothetical protein